MGIDLVLIWAIIIAFALMMYVIMDGFDLGIGILFPFIKGRDERDTMVNSVAPVWDGNETWLVLGGAALFAAFPLAYAIILSALYFPLILMLASLILRGVAFEFRFKADEHHKPFWDKTFCIGSYCATFFQGVALGAFINGFGISNNEFGGGVLDWITPFSIFTGFGLLVAYALLGATWLIMKTEGDLQTRILKLTKPITYALFFVICIVSIWTPLTHLFILNRWFSLPNIFYLAPVPFFTIAATCLLLKLVKKSSHAGPFITALFILFMGYTGLAISMWPYIIPPFITIWDASAPVQSLSFLLVGTLIIIPIILVYTAWSYYVFKGKVKIGEGYH